MKKVPIIFFALVAVSMLAAFMVQQREDRTFNITAYKAKNVIRCSPDWNTLSYFLDSTDIPPMPGAGSYEWKISTNNDSAQFYFNQGINMYYGFHIIEALASFKKAARFDAESPMVWWAQALAYGPNINDMGYNASPEALVATQKAADLMQKATPEERGLIHAMMIRYSSDSTETREKLNQTYADAMKKAAETFSNNTDILALYAEAMMLQHPWDLWNNNGTPKPWTPTIEAVLEKAIAQSPLHPGCNHYYIHVMEPSPYPYKALASADRLGKLTPGLSHMVHMPSHIYLRTGQFNKGVAINEEAVSQYKLYNSLFPAVQQGMLLYQLHNQHMQANCAMLAGRYKDALQVALALQQAIDTSMLSLPAPLGSAVQYVYMTPLLIHVRFEQWDSLLHLAAPVANHVNASILYHFGRGMAFTAKNDISSARDEERQMKILMQNEDLKIPVKPFSAVIESAITADELLQGFIAFKENKAEEAITHLTKAVQEQEGMVYNEPRDWLLNPRQYLGSIYLRMKQYEKAAMAFRNDLKVNDQNTWSLYGLQQALQKGNKKRQAALVKQQFSKAAGKSDTEFSALFF